MGKPTIEPVVWDPPPAPEMAGVYARNDRLDAAELWPVPGTGPEDVVLDDEGRIFTGLADGRVLEVGPPGTAARQLANTGGRPLGIELMPDGRLLVCDAYRGLLLVDPDGDRAVEPLLQQVEGRDLVLTNNASVGPEGTVYFTESTTRFPLSEFRADILEHSATGALWRLDPSGEVHRLHTGLAFANGVALTPDGSAVLVAETAGYTIHRIRLSGPAQGAVDVFAGNLPGFLDNLSTGPSGTVWCALPSPRVRQVDLLKRRHPLLRKLVWRIPERLQPDAERAAFVLGFDGDGNVTHNLQGDGERFHYVTGVREHDGWLYLGSLVEQAIARVRVGTAEP